MLFFKNDCVHLEAIVNWHLKLTLSFNNDVGVLSTKVHLCSCRNSHAIATRSGVLESLPSKRLLRRFLHEERDSGFFYPYLVAVRHNKPIAVLGV